MFPAPKFLVPHAAGIDISDASIKWVLISDAPIGKRRVDAWGSEALQEGVVSSGAINDEARLTEALRAVRKKMPHVLALHASLPEEPAFVFNMTVPLGSTREEIFNLIEFEFEQRVPIPPAAAVYDYDLIPRQDGDLQQEIGVVVFPRELAESYARCFADAGFLLLSLELEPRAIARAVVSEQELDKVTLLVDFGAKRSGLAVLKCGIPIFTSTVEIGIDQINRALSEQTKMSSEEIETWKNEQGLIPSDGQKIGLEAVSGAASALGSEVARHFNYWDTRRNDRGERVTPVSRVLLVGGGANLAGLGDYIGGRVQADVIRPDVWQYVCSFEEYIPPIPRRTSLQYVTAIGLAMR